jgi:transposase InsO family protein
MGRDLKQCVHVLRQADERGSYRVNWPNPRWLPLITVAIGAPGSAHRGVQALYIDPGKPWQNGKEERFNGTRESLTETLSHIHTPKLRQYLTEV